MRVRDMPRKQQKAVFARMGDGTRLEGVDTYHARHERLVRSGLSASTEDRVFNAMNDKKLTYRQRMAKATEIKKSAEKKPLSPGGGAGGAAPPGSPQRPFGKKRPLVGITSVPTGINRESFDYILMKKRLGKSQLYEHEGLLLTQKEYVTARKREGKRLPEDARLTEQPGGINRHAFNEIIARRKPDSSLYIKVDGITLSASEYRKALKRNARVRYGVRDWKEKNAQKLSSGRKEAKKRYRQELEYEYLQTRKEPPEHYAKGATRAIEMPVIKQAPSFERGSPARAERDVIAEEIKKKGGATAPYAVATNVVKAGGRSSNREAVAGEFKEQKMYKKEKKEHPTLPPKAVKTIVHDHMKKEGWEHNSPWKRSKRRAKKPVALKMLEAGGAIIGKEMYKRYSPKGRKERAQEKLRQIREKEKAETAEKAVKQAIAQRKEAAARHQAEERREKAAAEEKRAEQKAADERHRKEYAERHPGERQKRFGLF